LKKLVKQYSAKQAIDGPQEALHQFKEQKKNEG